MKQQTLLKQWMVSLGIGKYKGYGLSFMTDILTISGGGYGLMLIQIQKT